ncbi:MAG TPA: hypothetical protein VHH09_04060 [Acidimicrobiales bacterium]|nr:hypothetical protein [Acidimicrobiales bacterium]
MRGLPGDRVTVAFLVPAGALAGHAIGYAAAGGHAHSGVGHGYLAALTAVAVPLALATLGWQAYRGATRGRRPALGPLVVAQPLLFLLQESLEHLVAGHGIGSVAASPAVVAGVLAQAIVAGLVLLFVRAAWATGRAAAAALRRRRRRWGSRPPVLRPATATAAVVRFSHTPVSERGPPSFSFLA